MVQIAREGLALADGMLIPIRRYCDIDLPRSDINASRIRLKRRTARLTGLPSAVSLCRRP
jgi:hypothetical protein